MFRHIQIPNVVGCICHYIPVVLGDTPLYPIKKKKTYQYVVGSSPIAGEITHIDHNLLVADIPLYSHRMVGLPWFPLVSMLYSNSASSVPHPLANT
jgi:hypothetical protein